MRVIRAVREAQPRARLGDADDRVAHRGRAAGDVRARSRRGGDASPGSVPTSTTAGSSSAPREPRRCGLGRLGLRRRGSRLRRDVRPHRRCVHRSAARRHRDAWATRSAPSCSPSNWACRSPLGAAARWRRWTPPPRNARTIDYPVVIKPQAGRGGRGIHFAACEKELAQAFERARAEALLGVRRRDGIHRAPCHRRSPGRGSGHRRQPRRSLGCGRERLLDPAPQPKADRGVVLPGAQRQQEHELRAIAVNLARSVGYRNVGTVEFLYQPDQRRSRSSR